MYQETCGCGRSLLLESVKKNSFNSLDNLNELGNVINFLNLDTEVMLAASQIWVETRKIGQQTADTYNIYESLFCNIFKTQTQTNF